MHVNQYMENSSRRDFLRTAKQSGLLRRDSCHGSFLFPCAWRERSGQPRFDRSRRSWASVDGKFPQQSRDSRCLGLRHLWAHIDRAKQTVPDAKDFTDHRELLSCAGLDAVYIAVPDHWHASIAIEALKAGKDVYVEKPLTRLMEEGMPIVKAARENNRVCQAGMQQRSGSHYLQAKEKYFESGKIGTVTLARTWWYGNAWHLRKAPQYLQPMPEGFRLGSLSRACQLA